MKKAICRRNFLGRWRKSRQKCQKKNTQKRSPFTSLHLKVARIVKKKKKQLRVWLHLCVCDLCSTVHQQEFACQSVRYISRLQAVVVLLFYSEIGVRTEISTVLLNESDAVILNPGDHVLALFHLSRRKISERADFGFLLMKKWKNRGTVIFFPTSRWMCVKFAC